ncbi:hypothetical protein Q5752_000032 [Cryptotrichosporon argae]
MSTSNPSALQSRILGLLTALPKVAVPALTSEPAAANAGGSTPPPTAPITVSPPLGHVASTNTSTAFLAPPPFLASPLPRASPPPSAPLTPSLSNPSPAAAEPASATSLFSAFSLTSFFMPPGSPAPLPDSPLSPRSSAPSQAAFDHVSSPPTVPLLAPPSLAAAPSVPVPTTRALTSPEARQLALLLTQHLWPVRHAPKALMAASIGLAEDLHAAGVRWDARRRVMGVHVRGCWEEGSRLSGLGGVGGMELYVQGCFLTVAEKPHPLDTMPLPLELKPARIAALPKLTPHAGLGSSAHDALVPGLVVAHAHPTTHAFAAGHRALAPGVPGDERGHEWPSMRKRHSIAATFGRPVPLGRSAVGLGMGLVAGSMARRPAPLRSPAHLHVEVPVTTPQHNASPRSPPSPQRRARAYGSLEMPSTPRTPRTPRTPHTPRTPRTPRLHHAEHRRPHEARRIGHRANARPPEPVAKTHGMQLALGMDNMGDIKKPSRLRKKTRGEDGRAHTFAHVQSTPRGRGWWRPSGRQDVPIPMSARRVSFGRWEVR